MGNWVYLSIYLSSTIPNGCESNAVLDAEEGYPVLQHFLQGPGLRCSLLCTLWRSKDASPFLILTLACGLSQMGRQQGA